MRFLIFGTSPLGALLGGALGSWLGVRPALWILLGAAAASGDAAGHAGDARPPQPPRLPAAHRPRSCRFVRPLARSRATAPDHLAGRILSHIH
jgi:hypothetical protein